MANIPPDDKSQSMNQCCPSNYNQQMEDEIDLMDIIRLLLNNKLLIVGLVLCGLILSGVYSFTRPIVYQSEGLVRPLAKKSSKLLYTSSERFIVFVENINLIQQRSEIHATSSYNKKNKTLILQSDSPAKINELISLSTDETIKYFQNEFNIYKERSLNGFKQDLFLLSEKGELLKKDRLVQLQEAFTIAKAGGITNPILTEGSAPLYFYGTKILSAEIQVVKNRKNEYFTTAEIRNVQGQIERVKLSRFDIDSFKVMKIIKPASAPQRKAQKNSFIITLGGFLGLFSSLLVIAFLSIKTKLETHD